VSWIDNNDVQITLIWFLVTCLVAARHQTFITLFCAVGMAMILVGYIHRARRSAP